MNLTDDDVQMGVHDFFTPALLLEFVDLPDLVALIQWGERQFDEGDGTRSVRRLADEPDAGCLTHWSAAPGGFRYLVEAPGGIRSGFVDWHEVHRMVNAGLTPVRYGALRAAVESAAAHDAANLTRPIPFRMLEAWASQWARRASELAREAAAALDAICPPVKAQPALF
ncbi:hypothetical protein [Streptomyces noursei]|uniref:hypothetical protein n=1 Tax=Streptomyces noursei TaxID=1971 RepID=UPI001677D5F8|nr:hypothetical protein [Streptomyces noursei]MCZ1019733.1 hypothetical protein [Streptomyces noursei]GGX50956.1 hypothetical protein GCM10010341_85650 [Streptomyces noursei]